MASELRVNTLKDASGNNSIGYVYVAEGTQRQWVYPMAQEQLQFVTV